MLNSSIILQILSYDRPILITLLIIVATGRDRLWTGRMRFCSCSHAGDFFRCIRGTVYQTITDSNTSSLELPPAKRCDDINTYHTLEHLFSLQLCFKIMETMSVFSEVEFKFFSFGAPLTDKLGQRNNPTDWLPPQLLN